ncbi:hypothetical protein AB0G79_16940 [Streptomyces sp. NPDC020807]|uniref:hypothetical protein n=1 Tax=Streptomyces sp. NPDC020807 TaxID=3155119 RepID=UPI0033C8E881
MSTTIPYQRRPYPEAQALTTFRWQVRSGDDGVEAVGECPQCRCETKKVITGAQYVTKGKRSLQPLRDLLATGKPRHARCQCSTWHLERPAEIPDGCGASFWIAVPPQGLLSL